MPTFTYHGEDRNGTHVSETVEAADRYAVYEIARTAGHVVTKIETPHSFNLQKYMDMEAINVALSRVKSDELVMITKNLGAMLDAGLPLSRALSVIERQSRNPRLKQTMGDIRDRISRGEQFNEALAAYPKVFDDLFVAMVRAGEESGGLSNTLRTLGTQMERSSSLKKKIRGAMIYPAIVITIMIGIGILMMIYVMPSITTTFVKMEIDLPTTTRAMIAVSNVMVNHTFLVLGGMVAAVAGFIYFLRTGPGKRAFSFVITRVPVIGTMAKETNAARTARTLSSLLSSGVDVIRAITITRDVVQNYYYKQILATAATSVEKGTPLSDTFIKRDDLYPVLVGEMILVGEETGQIAQMLEQLAVFYENEVEQKTKDLSTIIEPILMVVIGGAVGFFALAMITPIYSISDSIG